MAKQVFERLVDDLDGKVLEEGEGESIEFAYRGKQYSIDLSKANAAEFDTAMEKYIAAAAPVRGSGAATRRPSSGGRAKSEKEQTQAARDWLRDQGHQVSGRGRIKRDLMDLYNAAH